jgi:dihydroorotase
VIDRQELGTLSPGAAADVAVFELEKGDFGFIDSGLASMRGTQRLLAHMTINGGKVVWDLNGITRPDWASQGDYIRLN